MGTIERLEKLLAEATPGPWRPGDVDTVRLFVPSMHRDAMGPERVLLVMNEHFPYLTEIRLIAELHNATPAFLAIAKAARRYTYGGGRDGVAYAEMVAGLAALESL